VSRAVTDLFSFLRSLGSWGYVVHLVTVCGGTVIAMLTSLPPTTCPVDSGDLYLCYLSHSHDCEGGVRIISIS
jgi:hypothetical protein